MMKILILKSAKLKLIPIMFSKSLFLDLDWLPCFVYFTCIYVTTSAMLRLSNDVHLNPGPYFQNSFLNFMSWNVNSLAEDNFNRVRHIEAHNSIFNYDLISICETSLNDSVELLLTLLSEYTFVPSNNPANTRHGRVGLFYKNSLPVRYSEK